MRALLVLLVLLGLAPTVIGRAQDDEFVRLSLRVTSTGPVAIIDRGTSDGLKVGDLVVLFPHSGGTLRAVVRQPSERSATLELPGGVPMPPVGTRGEVLLPRARLESIPAPQLPIEQEGGAPEHEPWVNVDEEWTDELPLLAQVGTIRPEERATIMTGRV